MKYSSKAVTEIEREYSKVLGELQVLWISLARELSPLLKTEKGREYVNEGVCRRLTTIRRCMENIFTLFPANRTRLFSEEERSDLEINLHAFLINSHGIPDNLALAYVEENNLQIPRHRAGMFRKEIKPHLPEKVRTYLDSNNISSWHKEYAKNYRDALAHRIPPYIPPLLYTAEHQFQYKEFETRIKVAMEVEGSFERAVTLVEEQETIGIICPFFMHSHTDSDAMQFHPQIIVDARTVIEIISVVRPHLTAR